MLGQKGKTKIPVVLLAKNTKLVSFFPPSWAEDQGGFRLSLPSLLISGITPADGGGGGRPRIQAPQGWLRLSRSGPSFGNHYYSHCHFLIKKFTFLNLKIDQNGLFPVLKCCIEPESSSFGHNS